MPEIQNPCTFVILLVPSVQIARDRLEVGPVFSLRVFGAYDPARLDQVMVLPGRPLYAVHCCSRSIPRAKACNHQPHLRRPSRALAVYEPSLAEIGLSVNDPSFPFARCRYPPLSPFHSPPSRSMTMTKRVGRWIDAPTIPSSHGQILAVSP